MNDWDQNVSFHCGSDICHGSRNTNADQSSLRKLEEKDLKSILTYTGLINLTPLQMVTNLDKTKSFEICSKKKGTVVHWYSFDSTWQELSNEFQHDRV